MKNYALIGFAKEDITPEYSVEMVGYTREDNKSRGVMHQLVAQVTCWKFREEKCCLVAIDHIGFMVEDSNFLRNQIAEMLNIQHEKVMLCFSHTHSSVNITDEPAYFQYLCRKVLKAVEQAENNMFPFECEWNLATAELGVNRRDEEGALDKRIGILKIVDAETKRLKLVLLRVTAHANVLPYSNYLISSDYIGVARTMLEAKYNCDVIITQGASGNVSPKYTDSVEALELMAKQILQAVEPSLSKLEPAKVERIEMYASSIEFQSDVPSIERAKEIKEEALRENNISGEGWIQEVERLHKEGIKYQIISSEIQYFHINNGCFCGVPNEIMCEIAIEVADKCQNDFVFFSAYTNGTTGYLPTAEEYDRGGFEVLHSYLIYYIYHGFVMPLNRDSSIKLVEHVINNRRK